MEFQLTLFDLALISLNGVFMTLLAISTVYVYFDSWKERRALRKNQY